MSSFEVVDDIEKIRFYARKLSLMAFERNLRPYFVFSAVAFFLTYSIFCMLAEGRGIFLFSLLLPIFLVLLMTSVFVVTSFCIYFQALKLYRMKSVDIECKTVGDIGEVSSVIEAGFRKHLNFKIVGSSKIYWLVYTKPKSGDSGTLFFIAHNRDCSLAISFSPILRALTYRRERDVEVARQFLSSVV